MHLAHGLQQTLRLVSCCKEKYYRNSKQLEQKEIELRNDRLCAMADTWTGKSQEPIASARLPGPHPKPFLSNCR